MAVNVLHRADRWVAVDKPSGVSVHRSALNREPDAMLQRVRDHLGAYVHPVHRLDRPTSGCLLFALDPAATRDLQVALQQGRKTYWALVRGHAPHLHGLHVERPLRSESGADGAPASTYLTVLAAGRVPRATLVAAHPATGRFHQVRRHLAGLSHPVLGDSTHGDTRANRAWRLGHGLERLFLHCAALSLTVDGQPIVIRSPLPPDLRTVLDPVPWWTSGCLDAPSA